MGLIEPGSESLAAMAAGTLDPVFRLMLETRARLDTRTAGSVLEADLIGSAFFDEGKAVAMRECALGAVMDRLEEVGPASSEEDLPDYMAGLPDALCSVVSQTIARDGWLAIGEGVSILSLQIPFSTLEQNGGNVFLVEIEAGSRVDRHRHLGEEYTLVLKGAVIAEDEDAMPVGSLLLRQSGSVHRPEATCDEQCAAFVILTGGVEYVPLDGDRVSA